MTANGVKTDGYKHAHVWSGSPNYLNRMGSPSQFRSAGGMQPHSHLPRGEGAARRSVTCTDAAITPHDAREAALIHTPTRPNAGMCW